MDAQVTSTTCLSCMVVVYCQARIGSQKGQANATASTKGLTIVLASSVEPAQAY